MNTFFQAKEIVPGVWIGSAADARNKIFMRRHNIGLVVNASKNIPFYFKHILGYRVAVDDDPSEHETMLEFVPTAVQLIDDTVRMGRGVLVHCYAGIQRSSTVVAAYLMKTKHMTAVEAMRYIKDRKPEAFSPVPTFEHALDEMMYRK